MSIFIPSTAKCNPLLFEHHIQYILTSGLILDEDMDNILSHYTPDEERCEDQNLTFNQKLLGACSFASFMFMIYKKQSVSLSAVTACPFVVITITHLRDKFRSNKRMSNLQIVVEMISRVSKLNRMVVKYFETRRHTDSVTVVDPYTKRMRQLVDVMFDEEVNIFYTFIMFIREFGSYVPLLKMDYVYLENIDFKDFTASNVKTVNDGAICLKKLCDVYVLLSSNWLTCLALVLCPSIYAKYEVNFDHVINEIIPKMRTAILNCYDVISKKFDDVKYYYLNRSQFKNIFLYPKPKTDSKLQTIAYNTMSRTTEILEKSKTIYKTVQQVDLQNSLEKEKLATSIYELRSVVFDYFESLDLLYKICQLDLKACQSNSASGHIEIPKEVADVERVVIDASLNPVEPVGDEEYEIYIGANETPSDSGYYEEECCKFASLLSQELKAKLRTHERFIAARKKRGIVDEELEEANETETEEPVVMEVPELVQTCEDSKLVLPPPPPPPMPPVNLSGNEGLVSTLDNFLEGIRAASKSRSIVEEVFGSSSDDELVDD